MQRVWTVVLSVWAMLAIVTVLAWAHRPAASAVPSAPQSVVVTGANGKQHVVLVQPGAAAHATTSTSAVIR